MVGELPRAGPLFTLDEPGPHFRPPAAPDAVILPFRLHAEAVEELLERLPPLVDAPRFDARHVRAAEPGAVLSLMLLAGMHGVVPPALPVPRDALIPPTRVADALGAAALFEAVAGQPFIDRLAALGCLPVDARAISSVVRELSRNAIEHAGGTAWVAAWQTSPGELRIAVADSGAGLSGSLRVADEQYALLEVLLRGRSRFTEGGRGLGLRRVSEAVARWGGEMRIRSRTVALAGTPPWRDAAVQVQLPYLPGVQVEVTVPCLSAVPRPRR